MMLRLVISMGFALCWLYSAACGDVCEADSLQVSAVTAGTVDEVASDTTVCEPLVSDSCGVSTTFTGEDSLTIFELPYSRTLSRPNWKHLWINTSVLVAGGITTLVILKALPSDATAWNKHENAKIPMFRRYADNVKTGPVWDNDNPVFNFVLHPYAGAAYYMGARGAGFNCWGSFLYSFCISTFFWEYGFEAFNEIPSVQDLIVTPVIGSLVGEGFYLIKRKIVSDGYRLWGSKVLGYAVAFLFDPLNEVTGYFRGDQKKLSRRADRRRGYFETSSWISPSAGGMQGGISITYKF